MMLKEEKSSSSSSSRPDTKCIWSKEEDRLLVESMTLFENHRQQQGIFKWSDVAKQFTVAKRSGKQCKERWMNHLDPNLKKHPWTHDEDLQLLEAQRRLGNSWTKIALEIDGRGENDIKNRWYSAALRKKRKPEDTRTVNDYYAAATSLKMLCKEGYASSSSTYESYLTNSNYYRGYGLISSQQDYNPLHNDNDGVGESLLKSRNVSEVSPFVYHTHQQQQHHHQQQQQQQQQLQQQQNHQIQTMSIQLPEFSTTNIVNTNPPLFAQLTLQKEDNTISTSENTSDSDPFIYNHNNFFGIRSANNSNNNSNNNSGYTSPSSTLYNALLSACQSPSWLGESNFQDDKTQQA